MRLHVPAWIQKVCQWCPTVTFFFVVDEHDEGREDPNTTICGPSSATSEMPFKWRFAGVLVIAMKPYIFVIFLRGPPILLPPPPPPPRLDPHMTVEQVR